MTLKDARTGDTVRVRSVKGFGGARRRIMDMGITKGVIVRVEGAAPFGDPIVVSVRGYELVLRRADAEMIETERYKERNVIK